MRPLAFRCELGRALGFELGEGTAGGASDGNTTSLHAATLDGLGAVGGGAHAAGEFLWTEKLAERAALLALLLLAPSERSQEADPTGLADDAEVLAAQRRRRPDRAGAGAPRGRRWARLTRFAAPPEVVDGLG